MPLVSAKCTSCGATLNVDQSLDAAICPYCGTPYIVEKAINNYNTTYRVDNLKADVVNINSDGSAKARIDAGNAFIQLKEFDNAYTAYFEAAKLTPQDFRTWWGCLRARTRDFTLTTADSRQIQEFQDLANKAFQFMTPDEKQMYSKKYYDFIRPLNIALGESQSAKQQEIDELDRQIGVLRSEHSQIEKNHQALESEFRQKQALFNEANYNYQPRKGARAFGFGFIPLIILIGNIWYGIEEGFNSDFGTIMVVLNGIIVFIVLCIMIAGGIQKGTFEKARDERDNAEKVMQKAGEEENSTYRKLQEVIKKRDQKKREMDKL